MLRSGKPEQQIEAHYRTMNTPIVINALVRCGSCNRHGTDATTSLRVI